MAPLTVPSLSNLGLLPTEKVHKLKGQIVSAARSGAFPDFRKRGASPRGGGAVEWSGCAATGPGGQRKNRAFPDGLWIHSDCGQVEPWILFDPQILHPGGIKRFTH